MKHAIVLLCSLLAAACTTPYRPTYSMKEVQVVNLTGATIRDVSWTVLGSDRTLHCNEVINFHICSEYFARRRYPQSGIEVNWTHADGTRKTAIVNPHVAAYFSTALPLHIFLEIDADGEIKAYYRQHSPDGGRLFIPGG
jgi:hypothetical protein